MDPLSSPASGSVLEYASISVMKKSQQQEQQTVKELLSSVAQPSSNPAHLGQNVDVRA